MSPMRAPEKRLAPTPADSRFELVSEFQPRGRPADRPRRADGRAPPRRRAPGPARGHGQRQDLHHGLRAGPGEPSRPGAGPQQDPGRAALPGVQGLLPQERGRVLRVVLRLLPARGLRPPVGHLHRQGSDHQRRDRPHAAERDAQPLRAARRHHRGLRVVHLRPGLAGVVLRDAAVRAPGGVAGPARAPLPSSSTPATTATTSTSAAGRSACAGT